MFDRYTKLFCIGYILSMILLMIVTILLGLIFNIDVPTGASIATIIGGTVFVSSKYAYEVGHVPVSSVSWKYAFRWSLFAILSSASLVLGILLFQPEVAAVIFGNILVFLMLLLLVFMVCVLIIRITFPYFVQTQLRMNKN